MLPSFTFVTKMYHTIEDFARQAHIEFMHLDEKTKIHSNNCKRKDAVVTKVLTTDVNMRLPGIFHVNPRLLLSLPLLPYN